MMNSRDLADILATIMVMRAGDLSASVLMQLPRAAKGSLPESDKIELMINRSFSAHATLSGGGKDK